MAVLSANNLWTSNCVVLLRGKGGREGRRRGDEGETQRERRSIAYRRVLYFYDASNVTALKSNRPTLPYWPPCDSGGCGCCSPPRPPSVE